MIKEKGKALTIWWKEGGYRWVLSLVLLFLLCLVLATFLPKQGARESAIFLKRNGQSPMLQGKALYYVEGQTLVCQEGDRVRFRKKLPGPVRSVAYGPVISLLVEEELIDLDAGSGKELGRKTFPKAQWVRTLSPDQRAVGLMDRVLLIDQKRAVTSVRKSRALPQGAVQGAQNLLAFWDGGKRAEKGRAEGQIHWDSGIAPVPEGLHAGSFIEIWEGKQQKLFLPAYQPIRSVTPWDQSFVIALEGRLMVLRKDQLLASIPLRSFEGVAVAGKRLAFLDGGRLRTLYSDGKPLAPPPVTMQVRYVIASGDTLYFLGEGKLGKWTPKTYAEYPLALQDKGAGPVVVENQSGSPAIQTPQGLLFLDAWTEAYQPGEAVSK